jgi:hypothetical protein
MTVAETTPPNDASTSNMRRQVSKRRKVHPLQQQGGTAMASSPVHFTLCFTVFLLLYSWPACSDKTSCRNNGDGSGTCSNRGNGTNENRSGDVGDGDGDVGSISMWALAPPELLVLPAWIHFRVHVSFCSPFVLQIQL